MATALINNQILYHGSDQLIIAPNLSFSRNEVDFGPGFYCTTNEEQAKEWGYRKMLSTPWRGDHFLVSEFKFSDSNDLVIRSFEKPDIEWLKAIIRGRNGFPFKEDIVIGPVADSNLRNLLYDTQLKISSLQEHMSDFTLVADYRKAEAEIYQEAADKAVPLQFRNDNQTVFVTQKGVRSITFHRAFLYDQNRKKVGLYDAKGMYHPYSKINSKRRDKDVRGY